MSHAEAPVRPVAKLSLLTLTAMVVGSMVGAGVFSLPRRFAQETGVAGALIAWAVAGTGMLMLAFVFQALAVRRPDLDAGVYAYAKAGFGEYLGFFSAFGYWASACVGNVTYWVLIMSTVGALVPVLGDGDTVTAVVVSSVGLWGFFLLIRRGVKEAAAINRIVTVAKIVPIVFFVILALFYFEPSVFADNFGGTDYAGSLFDQVRGTMLATVFVFLGVEGASVYSRHAKRREDVGRATVLGFLSVFAVFASVTIVSYGLLPMAELAELRQPSMAGVLESAVGTWGKVFISVGLIVSVLGAYLAWTLMAAEVLFVAAKDGDMPRFLGRSAAGDVPENALLLTTCLSQVVLVVTLFSADAFTFALDLTSALSLIPFLLAAAFAVKVAGRPERWGAVGRSTRRELVIAVVATLYTAFLLYAAGLKFVLVSFILYAPATFLFVKSRREQGRRLFSPGEAVICAVTVAGAAVGVAALAVSWIEL
ncbi:MULTISPECIES: basic amino acid/polyamine antiporter [Streptomyces]|uniref:basic amino acid/polyamine antiporter n=1 Tax=Streptomyces TaxID=1883 RepID=UPI00103B0360|nr:MULTISPECIES: basic amino acid/polyamine antiporter [Streptomyces]MBT3080017.1 basic amino acid/polyamine antiporter [Streptomyces sp. COG20]MBT3089327.1 basic amino acid/polyamine antiporter [Streptomyces sp. CYG21]MBT3106110.1 basic amino acid/polyamine antiporter [Streptomyces sp. COG19]MBT3112339.1 basic amino acid/polyamine antiporter [Streptomyces sp. CYG20]MDI7786385.1 basic amino acid/polyamine antiporter [Streptomyces cavourensis]